MVIGPLLKAEIESVFEVVPDRSSNTELCFVCKQPGCGDRTGNRSVNLQNGLTACWRCGVNGVFLVWARRLGYQFSHADDVGLIESVNVFDEMPKASRLPSVQPIRLPKGFTRILDEPQSVRSRYIGEMAVRKNLDFDTLAQAGVGFTRDDPRWEPFAIFPITEYGIIVYFQGRTYHDEPGKSTKLFPPKSEVKFGSRYWIYNIDEVRERKAEIVVIVESILNVLSLRKRFEELGWDTIVPVCVFKHSVSAEQALKLSRMPHIQEVCLLFDHDATARAWNAKGSLSNLFTLSVAEMPAGAHSSKLDPNDDVEAALDAIEKRQRYTPGNAFDRLINTPLPPAPLAGRRVLRKVCTGTK